MKKINSLLTGLLLSATVFLTQQANAQAPSGFTYQSVLRDANNDLIINTSVGTQISILQTTAGGTAVYVETHTASTNANGLLTLTVGSGAVQSGTFASIDWSAGPYFIKSETDPAGGASYTITGTQQMMSVPYALYAETSGQSGSADAWSLTGNAGTVDGTNFIGTTDNIPFTIRVNNQKAGRIDVSTAGNAFYGYESGNSNSGDNSNTGIGQQALYANTTGFYNTASGSGALYSNTTGICNTASGLAALISNTTGYFNTASGTQALYSNTTGEDNTASGVYALYSNTTGNNNTASGMQALSSSTTGSGNTAFGYNAGNTITTGSNNITIGNNAQVPTADSDGQIRIGNADITYAGVQVAWTTTSDKRWKSDVQPSNLGLDFISKLKPVSYTRNNDERKKREYGFIAQDLEETLNSSGASDNGIISKDDAGMYGVRYNDLMAPMVKAIQEQQELIKALQKEIEILKSKK